MTTRSASLTASATDVTEALGLGLGLALAALGEADAHVDAGVAKVEGVGVALAAVADDGDLLALDDRQVGVVVVEHLGHGGLLLRLRCAVGLVVRRVEPRPGGAGVRRCAGCGR